MSERIYFTVYGAALPKGSMKAFLPKGSIRPIVTSSTRGLKDWEHKIAAAAQAQATGVLLTGACKVSIVFYLPRPVSLPKRIQFHTKRPDLDKLIRGATDALKDVLWKDDAQAVEITAVKKYTASVEEAPRAEFMITPLQD